jgi:2-methylisocitrate lyase-like PEP mutase family enzyme
MSMSASADERRARFRQLHEHGCFVMPNPWDRGTAIALSAMGFAALATTSAGCAFALGRPDTPTALGTDEVLGNIAEIVDAVELPVNADFQAGYADDLKGLAANVARCVDAGVAGLSIEDAMGESENPVLPLPEAVERVRVARSAIDQSGADVLLTARAECFLYGHPDPLGEAVTRLRAFAEAGADVLYAPGVRTREDIAALLDAVRPLPLNVVMSSDSGLTVRDLADLGVRRISVGSALSRVAWGAFLSAARQIADVGRFDGLGPAASFGELNALFEPPQNR